MVALKSSFIRSVKATAEYQRGGRNGLKKIAVLRSPVKITLYDFKHTFATRMAQHGTNPKILQYLMGHESIETTMNFYVDFTIEYLKIWITYY